MNWIIVIGVIALLAVVGSVIAIAWWGLAARMAPYEDEIERWEQKGKKEEGGEVIRWEREGGDGQ